MKTRYGDEPRAFTNRLVVHAGEAPLPRFDERWLYGDLHYHSQMTDNEGESGYSYGNVARTLGAMGLDFVFATDHASGGSQQLSRVSAKRCDSIYGAPCLYTDEETRLGSDADPVCPGHCRKIQSDEARDLNRVRFQAAKHLLYGPEGVNLHVLGDARAGRLANFNGRRVLPQVYMGEEVDAWPEMSAAEQGDGLLRYGDGLTYPWPDNDGCLAAKGAAACRERFSTPYGEGDADGYLVRDLQGLPVAERAGTWIDDQSSGWLDGDKATAALDFLGLPAVSARGSRQHLIYFPRSTATTDSTGFVGSETGAFGGASRRLGDVIAAIEGQGVAFLAHPLVGRKPGGVEGPDIVPYSRRALNRAWRSPAILGLQIWNDQGPRHRRGDRRARVGGGETEPGDLLPGRRRARRRGRSARPRSNASIGPGARRATVPVFVDTNLLVYRFDTTEPEKQRQAQAWHEHLWRERTGRVSVQVLQELYSSLTRKLDAPMEPAEARAAVRALRAWSPVPVTERTIEGAWRLEDRYSLSWWDALIVAAAQIAGCRHLLTENLSHEQDYDGVRVVNPFRVDPEELGP